MTIVDLLKQSAQCHAAGKIEEAVACCRAVLNQEPNEPNALNYLGVTAMSQGRAGEAVALLQRAAAAAPNAAGVFLNLSLALGALAEWAEAAAACRRCVELDGSNAGAWGTLGQLLRREGKWAEAAESFRKATELEPGRAEHHGNLGLVLRTMGKLSEAEAAYRAALALKPNDYRIVSNLGQVVYDRREFEQAAALFRRAAEVAPEVAQIQSNLGMALLKKEEMDEAIACFGRALALQPELADTQGNLGMALLGRGEVEEAARTYRKAAELGARDAALGSGLLFALQFDPRIDAAELLREHQAWDERFGSGRFPPPLPHGNERSAGRRLKIGYLSPHFRNHCQSMFTIPLFENHDREAVEVYCYGDVMRPDEATARIRRSAGVWRSTVGMSDAAIARLIREDGIDVLVDLTMHMGEGRPGVMAAKPAPVQVAYLAYPGTTGMKAVDYRLTDPRLDPPGEDAFYVEKSFRLAETFWCVDPRFEGGEMRESELPVKRNEHVTFGCLNNVCKVNEGVLKLWSGVLKAVAGSRMILLAPEGEGRRRIARVMEANGVAGSRIEFVGRQRREAYLAEFGRIDICLDTFPYNGHTTSLDSAWMGAPVVSRVGNRVVGRAGVSQSHHLGVANLVARDDEGFVKIAVELAVDIGRLEELRGTLRERMSQSPLMNAGTFARDVEAAYREMWRGWCAGQR